MDSGPGREAPAHAEQVQVGEILGTSERLEFEHLLQWLRLSFLLTPILVLLAFGAPAVPYAIWIAAAVAASFTWVGLLARYRPQVLLRYQLWLRVLDCGLVYVVLVNYHAFLGNAYYDSVYVLFVVAGAATHGRRGAWLLSAVAGVAVLISREQLIATGAMPYEARHLTDAVFYTLFFFVTSRAVAFLMHKTEEVVVRRERALSAEISDRNTALERTARELAESVRLRDAMLAGVTHDLRTPVTVVKVQAQLLRRRADERLWSSIDQIERAATRMARWIDELLEIATIQRIEDLDLTLEPTDVVKIAREAIEEHQAAARRHTLKLDVDAEQIVGEFDASRLERVIDNLLGNAIKYSPAGGCVSLSLAASDGWVTIEVRDQGMGIPPEDLPFVFEPFRRGGNVVGRISGTGIGLSSAQRMVQRHGGTLVVASEPGQGSTFTVRLPLRQASEDGAAAPS
jgi:signal transduction histidine kinase